METVREMLSYCMTLIPILVAFAIAVWGAFIAVMLYLINVTLNEIKEKVQ